MDRQEPSDPISATDLIEIGDANATGLIPRRRGRPRSRTELWAMRTRGCVNAQGDRVVLRTIVERRTVYTTLRWINEYFAALATRPVAPSDRERRRRSHGNRHPTPQVTPDAASVLRRHGLASCAGLQAPERGGAA
jgi:hypothetical protein